MSEYELVLALNNAEAERVRWRAVAINTGNEITKLRVQIDQLKAQINRFKCGVESFNKTGSMNELLSAYIETPKQCLAEVKAKAIEDAATLINRAYYPSQTLIDYAKELREQAK